MATINPDWYAGNATRAYPLDDAATARDDAGNELPPQVLVDCRIKFPSALGRFAYISGVTVGPNIVTVVLLATADAARPPGTPPPATPDVPLGAVSLPTPVVAYRHYPIRPMAPGVGGWLVFGRGISEPYSGRFSTPVQSILLPRVVAAYDPLPIPTLGKLGVEPPLTGVIKLLGATDLEVVQDTREIGGGIVDAIVIRLVDALNRNVYEYYTGPCGGRPESQTCAKPALEAINGVEPDCAGNLTIGFSGAQAYPFQGGGGIALDLALGMADVCTGQDYLPDAEGNLPGDYEGACAPPGPPVPPGAGPGCIPMPFCDSFDEHAILPQWVVKLGSFAVEADDSPQEPCGLNTPDGVPINASYTATSTAGMNAAIWDCDYSVTTMSDITALVHLKIMPGGLPNGGIIFNYIALNPWFNAQSFLMATVDCGSTGAGPRLGVYMHIDGGTSTMSEWIQLTGALVPQVGHWYQLTLRSQPSTIDPQPPWNDALITLTLTGITDPTYPGATGGFIFTYDFPGAKFGIGSFNGHCRFSFFDLSPTGAALDCVALPYYDSFDGPIPTAWVVSSGTFGIEADDSPGEPFGLTAPGGDVPPGVTPAFGALPPLQRATRTEPPLGIVAIDQSYCALDQSQRNVAAWNCDYDFTTMDLTCTTHLKLMPGAQINGGIVLNFLASNPEQNNRPTYTMVSVDLIRGDLEFVEYNGAYVQYVVGYPFGVGNIPKVGEWYQLQVRSRLNPADLTTMFLTVNLSGVTDPAFKTMTINQPWWWQFLIPPSKCGLGTTNAHTRFSWFRLEITPPGGPP